MKSLVGGVIAVSAVSTFALLVVPACGSGGVQLAAIPPFDAGEGGGIDVPRGVGGRCDDGGVCRPGLACTAGVCQPGRSLDEGAACVISAECKDGFYCGPERKCAAAGAGQSGASCADDGECKSGLRCNIDISSLGAVCQLEGTGDVGGTCALSGDCFGGLLCAEKICVAPPPGPPPLGIPGFKGVACETETASPVAAYFRVPRGARQDDGDFFRLPFPNDVRMKNARPDLTGFPTPGADLLGFDLVDRWARYLEQTGTGWSAYPTVTFRFSGEIDFDSLKIKGATRWVDITPENGNDLGHNWSGTTGRTAYVCPNHLSFRPQAGAPLKAGHKYAVFMTNLAKAKDGSAIQVAPDLAAILGATDPGGALSAAYAAYAPLRTWATAKTFDLGTIVDVAVFTVGNHDDIAKKLATAVTAAPAPTATSWVRCGDAPSPCSQATEGRSCPAGPDPAFDELHALVTLPRFQQGNLPFTEPSDGGDLVLDPTSGQPIPQGSVEACLSLTVPKGTLPTGGWPLVIYAHGTGGSFRSHVTEGIATRLADIEGKKIAVLGIDQVGHGPRRGASTAEPQNVFFNFTNPRAARGNVLQGAADQMALVRFAKGLTLPAGTSPTHAEVRFGKVAFWGHSQGATEGSIAMPYVAGASVPGVIFSGVGGSLIDSLLSKKSPVNLAAIAPAILSELPQNVNAAHPALAMFQNAIDPADPLDHAAAITGFAGFERHVFVPYGQGDTYSPPITQLNYVAAANLAVATPPASVTKPDDLLRNPQALPIKANSKGSYTAVVRQYAPSGYDGHFVVFRDADAQANAHRFIVDVLTGTAPPAFGR
jgi:hypothetical protein